MSKHMNRIESRIQIAERAKLRVLRDRMARDIEERDRKERLERDRVATAMREAQEWAPQWRCFIK